MMEKLKTPLFWVTLSAAIIYRVQDFLTTQPNPPVSVLITGILEAFILAFLPSPLKAKQVEAPK